MQLSQFDGTPKVAILATGDELASGRDDTRRRPDPRQQHAGSDGRGARCRRGSSLVGHRARHLRVGPRRLTRGLAWADVIVASGGVSVGAHDVVKDAFAAVGRIDLWRVAVQPGKPLAFGRSGKTLMFGLPGNPVSSLVTFELFVRPVIRRLAGHDDIIGREIVRATPRGPVRKAPGRRGFVRVRLTRDGRQMARRSRGWPGLAHALGACGGRRTRDHSRDDGRGCRRALKWT